MEAEETQRLEQAVEAVLQRIVASADAGERLARQYQVPDLSNPGHFRTVVRPNPDRALFGLVLQQAAKWPEYHAVVDAIMNVEPLRGWLAHIISAPTDDGIRNALSQSYLGRSLLSLATDYMMRVWARPNIVDEALIAHASRIYTQSLVRNERHIRYLAPVYNASVPGAQEAAEIMEGFRLVTLNDPEYCQWLDRRVHWSGTWHHPTVFIEYDGVGASVASMGQGTRTQEALQEGLYDIVVGLRMELGGDADVWDIVKFGAAFERTSEQSAWAYPVWPPRGGTPTHWSVDKADRVRETIAVAQHVRSEFPIAYRRFRALLGRGEPEDRLIDLSIALEHLLLPSLTQELSFRFALRGAWVLHPRDAEERARRFKGLKELYKARSALVHGDPLKGNATELVEGAKEILSALMRVVGRGPYTREQWRAHLERMDLGAIDAL